MPMSPQEYIFVPNLDFSIKRRKYHKRPMCYYKFLLRRETKHLKTKIPTAVIYLVKKGSDQNLPLIVFKYSAKNNVVKKELICPSHLHSIVKACCLNRADFPLVGPARGFEPPT